LSSWRRLVSLSSGPIFFLDEGLSPLSVVFRRLSLWVPFVFDNGVAE